MLILKWILRLPSSTLFPYTTLFRSHGHEFVRGAVEDERAAADGLDPAQVIQPQSHQRFGKDGVVPRCHRARAGEGRSEEHTSELQSHSDLVCRLLLEKKKYALTCDA